MGGDGGDVAWVIQCATRYSSLRDARAPPCGRPVGDPPRIEVLNLYAALALSPPAAGRRPPAVTRPHAPLTGEFAAHPTVCRQAFQITVDFGFVAVNAIADFLPKEESLALVQRLSYCDCGCLALDDDELTRGALSTVAVANMTACQGLMLAATDYVHRTFGCTGSAPWSTSSPKADGAPSSLPR